MEVLTFQVWTSALSVYTYYTIKRGICQPQIEIILIFFLLQTGVITGAAGAAGPPARAWDKKNTPRWTGGSVLGSARRLDRPPQTDLVRNEFQTHTVAWGGACRLLAEDYCTSTSYFFGDPAGVCDLGGGGNHSPSPNHL